MNTTRKTARHSSGALDTRTLINVGRVLVVLVIVTLAALALLLNP